MRFTLNPDDDSHLRLYDDDDNLTPFGVIEDDGDHHAIRINPGGITVQFIGTFTTQTAALDAAHREWLKTLKTTA